MNMMVDNTENKLTEIVKEFVESHQIRVVEDVYQRDSVIEDAYHLIHQLVDHVGYYKD